MSWYAIGDIQGCHQELLQLLDIIDFSPSRDKLWVAGDLVNRGPNSLATLETLIGFGSSAECVLGNHDLHLLATIVGVRAPNTKDTIQEILDAPNCEEITQWIRHQPLIRSDQQRNISMVHAGIPPIWSLETAKLLASEVEFALQSKDWKLFLHNMYGNTPLVWDDALKGSDRLRTITNYLTRMRFCTAEGVLDLEDKSHRYSSREGFDAWFEFANPMLPENHEIIFGHWAALSL